MGKKNRKRGRVPYVLWRQFREKAASLSNTIVSLIPKACNCNSTGKCLRCIFGNSDDDSSMSYLVKPDDPSEYHDFMSTCFVVIPHDAPPLSPFTSFTRYWSQLQLVERTIQASLRKVSVNVICHGYKKFKLQCNTVKALTSWTWELALQRVGDSVMFYLLMHTLIFMPINFNAHHQVAGPAVDQLFPRFPMHKPPDDCGSSMHSRHRKKRRRHNGKFSHFEEPVEQVHVRADQHNIVGSNGAIIEDCLGAQCPDMDVMMSENCSLGQHVSENQIIEKLEVKKEICVTLPSWQYGKRCKRMLQDSVTQEPFEKALHDEGNLLKTYQHDLGNNICQGLAVPTLEQSVINKIGADVKSGQPHVPEKQIVEKLQVEKGKCMRLPSWQHRQRRKRMLQDSVTQEPSKIALNEEGNLLKTYQHGSGNDKSLVLALPTMEQSVDYKIGADVKSGKPHIPEKQIAEKLVVEKGKRLRLPSWQRRKRRKRMLQDFITQEGNLLKTYQYGSGNDKCQGVAVPTVEQSVDCKIGADVKSGQPMQLCPCCSVFQSLSTLSRVSKSSGIYMKRMFYNLKNSSCLFPREHVFYSLKSGFSGVNGLLQHIFGLSTMVTRNLPALCFHKRGLCSHESSCLYHSLIKLLRAFLRRAKKCHHKFLLEKHCSIRPLLHGDADRYGGGDVCSANQPSNMRSALSGYTQGMSQGMAKKLSHTKTRNCSRTIGVGQNQFSLKQPYCLKDEAVKFVWAVCRSIVPPELLGSPSSCRNLRKSISRFIRLRRFEKFSLKQCLHKLDVSKFPFLSNMKSFKYSDALSFKPETKRISGVLPKSRVALQQMLLERWIWWFFSHIVVPLVQTNFYVTESEHGKQNLYFYRKSVWRKLSGRVITWLEEQTYRSLDNASVSQILSKRSFGFSKVRLNPKVNGARPIANLKAPSRFCTKQSLFHTWLSRKQMKERAHNRYVPLLKSVNTVLQDLHVILKDVKVKEPERWGSTVFSYTDIHRKLCSFLRHLKEGQPTMPSVYIVVSDVEKAFDTVNQDKLLSILNGIQMADTYSIQKSSEIFCLKKSLWISKNLKLVSRCNNSNVTEAILHVHRRNCQTIVVNQEQSMSIRREKLYSILKEHLKHNVLQLGGSFYLQTVGIPQGSILSTLLCTLYYGHMERNVIFPYLEKSAHGVRSDNHKGSAVLEATPEVSCSPPKYLLLRFVDDFLFISTSKSQATSFLSRMRKGIRAYNCFMNQDKFCTNFDYGGVHKLDSNRLLVGSDGESFLKWSGLLINSCSLEVQADYSRYLSDHLSSTLTVNWEHRPGRHLKAKLFFYMQPKCHPMLFDASINSPATIRLNVYQAFVVCAMKFHCYVCQLSFWCKIQPDSCLSSIEKSVRYMYKLMRRKMHRVNCESGCNHFLQLGRKEVIWLGLTAYIRVLSKKRSRHAELLRLLRTKMAAVSSVGRSSKLKYAVDDSHSSYLWKIKY